MNNNTQEFEVIKLKSRRDFGRVRVQRGASQVVQW